MHPSFLTPAGIAVAALLSTGCASRETETFSVTIRSEDPARELMVQGHMIVDGARTEIAPISTPARWSGTGRVVTGAWECRTPDARLAIVYVPEGYRPMVKTATGGALGARVTLDIRIDELSGTASVDGGPILPPRAPATAP